MALREGDFVELEYTGRLKETGDIFDTTDEALAKKEGIHEPGARFGPVIVSLGQGFILSGVEKQLIGKEFGEYEFDIEPEQGFGKKSAKLVQLMPTAKLTKQNINPVPGLQLEVDGHIGTIKTVSGGRTIVDFNHPLAGRQLAYKVKAIRLITGTKAKADAVFEHFFRIRPEHTELRENELTVTLNTKLPDEVQDLITKKVTELTGVKKVVFKQKTQ
jgi:FKBP-type peptidyl-prolyl cis-trans isomerase 2